MKYVLLFVLVLGIVNMAAADQIFLIGQTKEGTFQGYEKGKFEFAPNKGRFITPQATGVSKLVLATNATKVTYQLTDGKEEESAILKGFEKSKFTLIKDGKEITVALAKMKKIDLAQEEGVGDNGKDNGGSYPIPAINLDDFSGDLTPEQQTAMDKFKAARKTYDDFVTESTAIVRQMDKAAGPKREDFLNKLRSRKIEEQPLRKALRSTYKAFVTAFPEQPANGGKTSVVTKENKTTTIVPPPANVRPVETKPADDGKTEEYVGVDTSPSVTTKPATRTIKINIDNKQPDKLEL